MITRSKMRRQLYRGGGITNLYPRQKYGIGSWVKDKIRDLIPNELADIAVKAAPFVAPFNPGVAGLMRGIGRFDQRGSLSDALKQGLATTAFGAGTRYLGGQRGMGDIMGFGKPGDRFTNPISQDSSLRNIFKGGRKFDPNDPLTGGRTGGKREGLGIVQEGVDFITDKAPILKKLPDNVAQKLLVGGAISGASALASYFKGDFRPQEEGESMEEYLAARKDVVGKQMRIYMDNYFKFDPEYSQLDDAGKNAFVARYNVAQGGRIGYQTGGTMMDLVENISDPGSPYYEAAKTLQDRKAQSEAALDLLNTTGTTGTTSTVDPNSYYAQNESAIRSGMMSATPTGEAGGIITDGNFKYRINADGSRSLIGTIGGGIPNYEGGSMVGPNLYKGPTGRYERIIDGTFTMERDPVEKYGEQGANLLYPSFDAYLAAGAPDVDATSPQTTDTAQVASPRTVLTDTGALKVIEPEGIQTVPTKKVFNVMMDEKGNVMKDQGIAQLARDTGVAPYIQNYPINSMSDVMRMIGPGTGIPQGTEYDSISMDRSLRENVAANEAQRQRVSRMFEAARSKLPGYGPGPVMPMQTNQYEKMFTNPGVVTQANPGGYRSEQEAIADLGIEKYNTMYNQGGRVGFSSGSGGLSEYEIFKLKELKYDVNKYGADHYGGVKVLREILDLHGYNKGGRVGQMHGTGPAGLPGIPRMAPDGMEFDMRQNGGFQPLGAKEKKDDVPAMLAKNEFVMTADAVRGAGNGDIELGAQKMYDTMKNLERRVT